MEHKLNILAEFIDKNMEHIFFEAEVRKSAKLARYMILFAAIVNLLIGIPDFARKDISINIIYVGTLLRIFILLAGIGTFIVMKKTKNTKIIGILILSFALLIYGSHIYLSFSFVPLSIMFETFNLIIFSTALFLMPNRWIINLVFSVAFLGLYLVLTPLLCLNASSIERLITAIYVCWNIIIVSVLFYSINVHKRNSLAKEIQLEALANTDHLTKIRNRQACDKLLDNSCESNSIFSYIMFDIDNFKTINDTYGHVAGDNVITTIVSAVEKMIRKEDTLARWGGEEFAIIMPGAKLDVATVIANRIKEQMPLIKHGNIKQPITCSFGVTSFTVGDNSKSITSRADQLLYLAKEYGRDRVICG